MPKPKRGPGCQFVSILHRTRRRARKYSIGFLAVVLASVCLWYVVTGDGRGHGGFLGRFDDGPTFRRLESEVDPQDHFSPQQRKSGAVALHCLGLLYMFIAIALVCDECFVPALEVISEVLDLSPDVAGATFMAAGGSAPEFFTSLIGVHFSKSDIGTGTIIGSAVFNVLFVIGACALISPTPLELTWWPLARDSTFYAVDLIVVTCVFLDEKVKWYEALILFICYILYTTFMKHSERVEAFCKGGKPPSAGTGELEDGPDDRWAESRDNPQANSSAKTQPEESNQENNVAAKTDAAGTGEGGGDTTRHVLVRTNTRGSHRGSDNGERSFRHKSLRIASHTELGKHEKTPHKDGADLDACPEERVDSGGSTGGSADHPQGGAYVATGAAPPAQELDTLDVVPQGKPGDPPSSQASGAGGSEGEGDEEEDEENEPLSLAPPGAGSGVREWIAYLIPLPIVVCLVFTVPDVRRDGFRKFFAFTFVLSILWIAGFTWVMVWFATVIAETVGIEEHIMGLTVLAAGTSVPDLLTSMIVARQGHGDMAVSSSIGSNIFDVTVGLPVPWMFYSMLNSGKDVKIKNEALEIMVMLLLGMLAFTIGTVVTHGWVMTKWMGGTLMFLYLLFEVVAVGLSFAPENSLKLIHV